MQLDSKYHIQLSVINLFPLIRVNELFHDNNTEFIGQSNNETFYSNSTSCIRISIQKIKIKNETTEKYYSIIYVCARVLDLYIDWLRNCVFYACHIKKCDIKKKFNVAMDNRIFHKINYIAEEQYKMTNGIIAQHYSFTKLVTVIKYISYNVLIR